MKTLKEYFVNARKNSWALGQFNFSAYETLKASINACGRACSPFIAGTSANEANYFGIEEATALIRSFRKRNIPVFLNYDHGKDIRLLKNAIDCGYDMIHFDGSDLPLFENIALTKELTEYAHGHGVILEGEIGKIGTKGVSQSCLTDPLIAQEFIEKTNVDILAVSIGSLHGGNAQDQTGIDLKLLSEIAQATKNSTPFVLHGGSGVPDEMIKQAICLGIAKININTEIRKSFTDALRNFLSNNPSEIVPYKYFPSACEAVDKVVSQKLELFMAINKA